MMSSSDATGLSLFSFFFNLKKDEYLIFLRTKFDFVKGLMRHLTNFFIRIQRRALPSVWSSCVKVAVMRLSDSPDEISS